MEVNEYNHEYLLAYDMLSDERKLEFEYTEKIESWDWRGILLDAQENTYEDRGEILGSVFLGTVFELFPSSKFWNCWANSNVSSEEQLQDIIWQDCLESIASDYGMWICYGDDPCDIFAECYIF